MEAKEVHGDRYDYDLTAEYINSSTKVPIFCRVPGHGWFKQTPDNHLHGHGCCKCGRMVACADQRLTIEEVVKRATQVHHGKYDYDPNVEFANTKAKIRIFCRVPGHGWFEQKVESHLAGHGCKKCVYSACSTRQRRATATYIEEANKKHHNKYDYDIEGEYVNYKAKPKIRIFCRLPGHGWFKQHPGSHLSGSGCPECGKATMALKSASFPGGYNLAYFETHPEDAIAPGVLYLNELTNLLGDLSLKGGITKYSVTKRNQPLVQEGYHMRLIHTIPGTLKELWILEQAMKEQFATQKYFQPIKFPGYTECFELTALLDLCEYMDDCQHGNEPLW